ncbi:hypothetical protein A8D95_04320 [Burkholderia cenocepacia]|nr:hypothetical protein A8D83_03420 [Burkholderia cenocepacia]ONJ27777.1 hypothetical protein A8D90_14820 [Burkholderia cenocepacia]ONP18250.1 hypothetical protein A8D84_34850 [Burkholderia cenocepacia]ONP30129.1 hypothetical protein A8D85_32820 [Burkholderia cenocepacia]ONP30998.1 hypothetical protein A8D86_31095 [Burkholderia cenocepacia]
MQLPKTAKNRNLETVRIRVLPPVLLAPLRRPSPAPLRRPATARPPRYVRHTRGWGFECRILVHRAGSSNDAASPAGDQRCRRLLRSHRTS